tara:strand:- start:721 stop:1287 length:567 start_codon:yes stop_codon:yes gene_type:complete
MKVFKKLMKFILLATLMTSLSIYLSHYITVGEHNKNGTKEIYLHDNGVHVDIIIPCKDGSFAAYGWGSKVFFMDVPSWDDLTYKVGFQALFTKPASCMRVTKYTMYNPKWKTIKLSEDQLFKVKAEIDIKFKYTSIGNRIHIRDGFYEAEGCYNALNTCNTWANGVLKSVGLKSRWYILTSESLSELY